MTNARGPRNDRASGGPPPFPLLERVGASELHVRVPDADALVVGTVQGLAAEALRVRALLDARAPTLVALGIALDDLAGLPQAPTPPSELTPTEAVYLKGLRRYGAAELPPPCLAAALQWGRGHGVPVHGLDLPEEEYAKVLFENLRGRDLLQQSLRQRSDAPYAPDALTYALAWGAEERAIPAYAEMQLEREGFMADRLLDLLRPGTRAVAVVDVADLAGIERALDEAKYLR